MSARETIVGIFVLSGAMVISGSEVLNHFSACSTVADVLTTIGAMDKDHRLAAYYELLLFITGITGGIIGLVRLSDLLKASPPRRISGRLAFSKTAAGRVRKSGRRRKRTNGRSPNL